MGQADGPGRLQLVDLAQHRGQAYPPRVGLDQAQQIPIVLSSDRLSPIVPGSGHQGLQPHHDIDAQPGLRIAEIVDLDSADLRISARKGHLVVRYGKGGNYREVPLHPILRTSLQTWLEARKDWPGAGISPALFLNRRGGRISTRGAYNCLAATAEAAGIDVGREADFTPHVLRHTVGTTLTRSGTDIILVAEILGHSVETARRYALPSRADRQTAIERLTTDQ